MAIREIREQAVLRRRVYRPDFEYGKRLKGLREFLTQAGCSAVVIGPLGAAAGAIWSAALGFGPGIGALYGGLIVAVLASVFIPVSLRTLGQEFPMGLVYVGLLVWAMLMGAMMWIGRAIAS
jgi:hypothetical protein